MSNRTSASFVLLFSAFALCAQSPSPPVHTPRAQPSVPHFRDVSAEVGLRTLPHTSLDRRYVIKTMSGGGVAFLDCDNNGELDIAVDFPAIIAALREIGYYGHLMIEGFGYSAEEKIVLWADVSASPEDIARKGAQVLGALLKGTRS
jgi:hypothetical protein